MNDRFKVIYPLALLAVLSLVACGEATKEFPSSKRYHELNALRAIIRHVGPPVVIPIRSFEPSIIEFDFKIALLERKDKNPNISITEGIDYLSISSSDPLGYSTELVRIVLADGREYKLLLSHTKEKKIAKIVRPQRLKVMKKAVEKLQKKAPVSVGSLLVAMQGVENERRISGYKKENENREKLLVNTPVMRGVILEEYQGHNLKGYVLGLQNLTDSRLVLSPEILRLPTGSRTVFSSPYLPGSTESKRLFDPDTAVKAYVVLPVKD